MLDFIDYLLIFIIAGIVGAYVYIRYREEKRKKEEALLPTLRFYRDKFLREMEEYQKKAQTFQGKVEYYTDQLKNIKGSMHTYRWDKDEKKILRSLKGTDFEWAVSSLLNILGFKLSQPPVYKDHNIDFIVEIGSHKICLDLIDQRSVKKVNKKYIQELIKGKEKYRCSGVWVITNSVLKEKEKSDIFGRDVNVFSYFDIVKYFPSIRIVEDFYETQTKLHNYELLHTETSDEVIRRKTWLKEIEEKIKKAEKKMEKK